MSQNFPGKLLLVDQISAAVRGEDCPKGITDCVRDALCRLVRDSRVSLPECVRESNPDHYCRRMLHRDDELGYTVMAMTWAPGQGTPIHDHAGLWCVEAVCLGQIEVTQYELVDRHNERYRLEPRATMRTGVGSAGSLIPPHEYHTIANPQAEGNAVTLHVYAGDMDCCGVYEQMDAHWYRRLACPLALDAA